MLKCFNLLLKLWFEGMVDPPLPFFLKKQFVKSNTNETMMQECHNELVALNDSQQIQTSLLLKLDKESL